MKFATVTLTAALLGATAMSSSAAETDRPSYNFYGVTGLIDMPSAESQPDGELGVTVSHFAGITRNTLSFQMLPRVQGAFRYTGFSGLNFVGFEDYYDRSFDISLQILNESRYLPAIKVGLQDFIGTGLLSGEYVVATKTFGPKLKVSGGIGWGRLGSEGDFGSPFGDRPATDIGRGGEANYEQWFRGPAAPFAGVEYQATDKLTLKAEYSSDAYNIETGSARSSELFERRSSFNFGADYMLSDSVRLGGYYLYGSEVGVNLNFSLNPYRPAVKGSIGPAPGPVRPRPSRADAPAAWSDAWAAVPGAEDQLIAALSQEIAPEGFAIESLAARGDRVEVRVRNTRYDAAAQAVGRVARAMTRAMPPSVETFVIVMSVNGVPASAVTLRRSDLETLVAAPEGSDQLLAVAGIGDAGPLPSDARVNDAFYPNFTYRFSPFIRNSYFDPDSPVRTTVGVQLKATYEPAPGFVISGRAQKKVVGNLGDSVRVSNSVLPHVRTDAVLYEREGDPALVDLYGAYYFRPGDNLYGRVTAGYLERMFGGVSTELLYKPVESRLGLGAELNYVAKRDFDGGFGFQDYDVLTGHVSAYYDFENGYHAQLDVGRYLAGDVGATLALDREFRNGWKVGAFATMTDVSADEFGEGSFDKGIRLTIPLSWFTGTPTRQVASTTIRPVTRDGGARLEVPGRLYEGVREYHRESLDDQWGRVWR